MTKKISWVILTYNRKDLVEKAINQNLASAGYPIDEIIWVDNGSSDGVQEFIKKIGPDVLILNKENLGVSKGYNRGFAMATGDLIVQTGCDRQMPENWLKTFMEYQAVFQGVGCMTLDTFVAERKTGEQVEKEGLKVIPCKPLGAKIFPRDLLYKSGYYREDMGLYGLEDSEWAERIMKDYFSYMIPQHPIHLGHDVHDDTDYRRFKWKELYMPEKQEVLKWCKENNYPNYNPYANRY